MIRRTGKCLPKTPIFGRFLAAYCRNSESPPPAPYGLAAERSIADSNILFGINSMSEQPAEPEAHISHKAKKPSGLWYLFNLLFLSLIHI